MIICRLQLGGVCLTWPSHLDCQMCKHLNECDISTIDENRNNSNNTDIVTIFICKIFSSNSDHLFVTPSAMLTDL